MTTLKGLYSLRLLQLEIYLDYLQIWIAASSLKLQKEFRNTEFKLMEERKGIRDFLNRMELEKLLCKQI
jgi:hypothetical protein